jgi:hypothetical protein
VELRLFRDSLGDVETEIAHWRCFGLRSFWEVISRNARLIFRGTRTLMN